MTSPPTAPAPPPKQKRSAFSYLAWWQINPHEVQKQMSEYATLKLWQSARGISVLLCLFSVTVTLLLSRLLGLSFSDAILEAAVWLALAAFMYRGHRWAFVAGMALWTLEKGYLLFRPASGGAGAAPIVQIIWWAVYMNAFYLAFTVERQRARGAGLPN